MASTSGDSIRFINFTGMPNTGVTVLCHGPTLRLRRSPRLAEKTEKLIFDLMGLAAELRLIIYVWYFKLKLAAIQKYFKRYAKYVLALPDTAEKAAPVVRKACPALLLVSKAIFKECIGSLYSTPLRFSHGLLNANLTDVISTDLLRNLTHLEITDSGISLTKPKLAIAFHGVQYLFKQLADVFENGHSLKSLKFTVKATDFNEHLRLCAEDPNVNCGIKAFLGSLCQSIGRIRSIEKVSFSGDMSKAWKRHMIRNMTSRPKSIFKLPLKIRQQIYRYTSHPNEGTSRALTNYMRSTLTRDPAKVGEEEGAYPRLSCPTILLINRQITEEAMAVIVSGVLVISGHIETPITCSSILNFAAPGILSRMHHLVIDFTTWQYISLIPSLPNILRPGHHGLRILHFRFLDKESRLEVLAAGGEYPDWQLDVQIRPLIRLRGLQQVTFEGSLPECYTAPLARTMMAKPGSSAESVFAEKWELTGLGALRNHRTVVVALPDEGPQFYMPRF